MVDRLVDNLALVMFAAMFVVIFCGYPVAFVMGGMALVFATLGWMLGIFPIIGLSNIVLRMWGQVAVDPVLVSIPGFIFMGTILERSGSAKDMLMATEVLLRRVPGALAVAVMVMGTILAAPMGVVGACVVTLSIIALPPMLASGYDKRLAVGTISSAGTLGILIPPAIMLVVMAEMLQTSAGVLFAAATLPGFLLSGLFLLYIIVLSIIRPSAAPRLPPEYGPQTRTEFWLAMWKGLFPMSALLFIVLGSIFAGWATATESAGVGVFGSMLIAALNGRLTRSMLIEAMRSACRANALVFLIFLGATGFSYVFRVLGGDDLMISTLAYFGVDTKWEMLAFVMTLVFLLGFPFEWIEICLIVLPIFGPILTKFDFSDHLGSNTYDGMVRNPGGGQPPDLVHDAAVRCHVVLHEGHRAARRVHERHLPRDVSVRGPAGVGTPVVHLLPRHRPLVAKGDRLPLTAAAATAGRYVQSSRSTSDLQSSVRT